MPSTRPPASVAVIAAYAIFTGAAMCAGILDGVISLRGGKPIFGADVLHDDLVRRAVQDMTPYVLLGVVGLFAAAHVGAGIGLFRSRGWARHVMRVLALIELACGVGAVFAVIYWRGIGVERPPRLDIDRVAFALLILAVLGRTGVASRVGASAHPGSGAPAPS